MSKKGLYIYGIIPTHQDSDQYLELERLGVSYIPYDRIAAVVSEDYVVNYQKLDTERLARLLVEHQKTIESIMDIGFNTIIPMRIGTWAKNKTEAKNILKQGHELIIEAMDKMRGCFEMDVVTTWADFTSTLTEIAQDPEVVALKKSIEQNPEITQADQISIGLLVKSLLDKKKETYGKQIVNTLQDICKELKNHEVQNENMVSNTACLLEAKKQKPFEEAIEELDKKLDGKLDFKLVGPLPCYSFFTLEVQQLNPKDIEWAKFELGLNNSTSEKLIKQAYHDKMKRYHPDKNPGEENALIMERIRKAYAIMNDYTLAAKSSREEVISLLPDDVAMCTLLVKIKE